MRKLAPVRVSCWADFFISYRVYIMTRSFQISLFEGTLQVDKIHVRFKIANMHMRYLFQSTRRLISPKLVVVSRLRDTVARFSTEWNSRPGTTTRVNLCQGDSCRHDMLWWYHVNKCRAMRGNRSELTLERKSPRCHVNTPLLTTSTAQCLLRSRNFHWNLQ